MADDNVSVSRGFDRMTGGPVGCAGRRVVTRRSWAYDRAGFNLSNHTSIRGRNERSLALRQSESGTIFRE